MPIQPQTEPHTVIGENPDEAGPGKGYTETVAFLVDTNVLVDRARSMGHLLAELAVLYPSQAMVRSVLRGIEASGYPGTTLTCGLLPSTITCELLPSTICMSEIFSEDFEPERT